LFFFVKKQALLNWLLCRF